jgi:hypothetical protein
MKTNFIEAQDQIKQILILSISTCFLLVILVFSFWLYHSNKNQLDILASDHLQRVGHLLKGLNEIKQKEMKSLALTLSNSSILKGALATGHKKTIEDVLKNVVDKNELDFAAVLEKKSLKFYYSNIDGIKNPDHIKEVTQGRYLGAQKVSITGREDIIFLIAHRIDLATIQNWEEITNAKILVYDHDGSVYLNNIDKVDIKWNDKKSLNIDPAGKYFFSHIKLLKETLPIQFLIERSPYWDGFKKKRNSLIILGLILFLIGIFISLIISKIISHYLDLRSLGNNLSHEHWKEVLSYVDKNKDALAK